MMTEYWNVSGDYIGISLDKKKILHWNFHISSVSPFVQLKHCISNPLSFFCYSNPLFKGNKLNAEVA